MKSRHCIPLHTYFGLLHTIVVTVNIRRKLINKLKKQDIASGLRPEDRTDSKFESQAEVTRIRQVVILVTLSFQSYTKQ